MNKEQLKFVVLLIGSFLLFYYFWIFWIGLCSEGGIYWSFAKQYLNFIKWYRELLIFCSVKIANIFDLQTLSNSTQMLIIGKGGINIVYDCVGYGILSALTAIGIAMPNKQVKQRIYFILIGFIIFTCLNSLRIFLIAYYMKQARELSIDHHDIFNYFCYALLMLGVYWWSVRRLGSSKLGWESNVLVLGCKDSLNVLPGYSCGAWFSICRSCRENKYQILNWIQDDFVGYWTCFSFCRSYRKEN